MPILEIHFIHWFLLLSNDGLSLWGEQRVDACWFWGLVLTERLKLIRLCIRLFSLYSYIFVSDLLLSCLRWKPYPADFFFFSSPRWGQRGALISVVCRRGNTTASGSMVAPAWTREWSLVSWWVFLSTSTDLTVHRAAVLLQTRFSHIRRQ